MIVSNKIINEHFDKKERSFTKVRRCYSLDSRTQSIGFLGGASATTTHVGCIGW